MDRDQRRVGLFLHWNFMAAHLVHLSDLHLGGEGDESWEAFDQVAHAMQTHQLLDPVSALIVSGDLGNHPDKKQFVLIKRRLEELCQGCGLDPASQLVVIPGNHDYRPYGNAVSWMNCPGAFDAVFTDWRQPKYLRLSDGQEVAIFVFDSNVSRSGWNFARGEIGAAGLHRFQTQYHTLKTQHSGFARAFKIAVTHHHPLPIAAAEAEHVSDAFLGLEDAGTFLRELVRREYGMDLVLHGHKHYPAFGRIKVFTSLFGERELSILAAGSACKRDGAPRGNSFNVITLEAGQVWAERWFRDTGSFEREPTVYDLLSYGAARNRAFEAFCLEPPVGGVHLARELHKYEIDASGDCWRLTSYEGLAVAENHAALREIPIEKTTRVGQFGPIAITSQPAVTRVQWTDDPAAGPRHLKGKITFNPPIPARARAEQASAASVDFRLEFRVFNGFAMNAEQAGRMYGQTHDNGRADSEWVSVRIKRPMEELEIEVKFPSTVGVPAIRVEVLQDAAASLAPPAPAAAPPPEEVHNLLEEEEGRRHLKVEGSTVSMKISRPLPRHRYGFSWQLPRGESSSSQALRGRALRLRSDLLALDTRHPEDNRLQPVLLGARDQVYQVYEPPGGQASDYELALWVFDENKRHLRCVAGVFDSAYWAYTLLEGQSIAGRAHKQNALICYVKNKIRPGEDYLAPPPAGCPAPEILLVLPLRYPLNADASGIVGLLALSILSPACKLLETKMEAPDYKPLTDYLYTECYENGILPQILSETQPTEIRPAAIQPAGLN